MHTIAIITVIKAERDALIKMLGGLGATVRRLPRTAASTIYHETNLHNSVAKESVRLVLSCIGTAGNPDSAACTAGLIADHRPDLVVLVGIAAGVKGKTAIGEVVVSERVIGYEGESIHERPDGSTEVQPRHSTGELSANLAQDLIEYSDYEPRIQTLMDQTGAAYPQPTPRANEPTPPVVATPVLKLQTIASGEKLLRDPRFLLMLKSSTHGRIEAGEMEATGVVAACKRTSTDWIIFRGISDLGDEYKSDAFHKFAATMATAFAVDFVMHGYEPLHKQIVFASAVAWNANGRNVNGATPNTTRSIVDVFEPGSREVILKALRGSDPIVGFLSVSPTGGADGTDASRRYHLGHAFFAAVFSELSRNHSPTGLLISPSVVYADWHSAAFNNKVYEITGKWLRAFDGLILPNIATDTIYTQKISDKPYSTILQRLSELGPKLKSSSPAFREQLVSWIDRSSGNFGDLMASARRQLGATDTWPNVRDEDLLSLACVLALAPPWYSAEWMTRTIRALTRTDDGSLSARFFDAKTMTIVEAKKNRGVWEAMRCMSTAYGILNFPGIALIENMPNTRGDGAMRTKDHDGCVPLNGDVTKRLKSSSDSFLSAAEDLLRQLPGSPIDSSPFERVSRFASEWQLRLGQTP